MPAARPVEGLSALLLDALGTLIELQPPAPELRRELAERLGVHVTETQARQAIAAEIGYYRAHLDEGRDLESLTALRRRCAEVVRAALPPSAALSAAAPAALTGALLASLRFTAFEDVSPALRRARRHGLRIVVVSNWDVSLHGVLERLAIAPMLDGIVTSAEAGVRKPAPQIFARALELAGAPPAEAVHVGDNLEEDVAGARAAGITPVLIRRDGGAGPAGVRTIASLAELQSPSP